ncbi:hypothetical protein EF847_17545 [Actinobacteria bacterium YIM 96077]|uniref:Uncharacterized protein n=1 Tax=Phytoactinopolyspora halophila TaxID=1981511 RepID=A0A329QTZ8_9ACTN|nr:hypothetical protein [Phytoactinopolyspora halophila]AYY14230.1 hypothetical protein EF847_17545 [Actinobacteria bacterium YIM 96077]RAW14772.1 hypothetical protein DPM12_09760 [Phytoactinopolyspora halophila]
MNMFHEDAIRAIHGQRARELQQEALVSRILRGRRARQDSEASDDARQHSGHDDAQERQGGDNAQERQDTEALGSVTSCARAA